MRRASVVLTLALTLAALAPAARADGPGYRIDDYADGQAQSVLPPGENGLVNPTDLLAFETAKTRPPGSDDQLSKYANLLYGSPTLTNATLGDYFDDESFGVPPGQVQRTESPEPGVSIYRDTHDVPHIYGQTDAAAAFGAGYAQAEDRLFLMDVLRHYGEGTLASFMGPSCEFEQMDHDQLLLAPYTEAQAQAQYESAISKAGPQGGLARTMVESYVAGVNAYIDATRLNPMLLPADYVAALGLPQPWKVSDTVAIAGLIGGIFGRGGGYESPNAKLKQFLQHKYGARQGARAFAEINHQDDPLAPTTIVDKRFPYDRSKAVDPSLTALPDYGKPLTGGPVTTSQGCDQGSGLTGSPADSVKNLVTHLIGALQAFPSSMSNALVVAGNHTASGHPVAVFGPQVSYFAPQILSEEEIQSPSYSAEGASFPGTGLVELGRGQDYAWSATSSMTDVIDTRVEKLCGDGHSYVFRGRCLPMTHETFSETVLPKAAGLGLPATIDHQIYLTRHGVVQGWTTVRGQRVAIVNQRSTFNHDIDSLVGFLEYGEPGFVHSFADFQQAAGNINFTFNWFYADASHIGYVVSGALPRRNPHVDTALPTWGTGRSEWRGLLPLSQHPHEQDPPQGFFVSWNNKPAPGVANDGDYHYGQTYRSTMLVDQLNAAFARTGDQVTRADVVQAMETAASQDLDGLTVMPLLVRLTENRAEPAGVRQMLTTLSAWVLAGAHRRKADPGETQYAYAAAVAISDELYDNLISAIYDPVFASGGKTGVQSNGGAVTPGYAIVPQQWVNSPNSGDTHLGSAYDESAWESYLVMTMQQILHRHPKDGWDSSLDSHLCLRGLRTCAAAIDAALLKTYTTLSSVNGTPTPSLWTQDSATHAEGVTMPIFDAIAFRALGIVGQPTIDWQNRPTFQQVVEFPRHR